MKNYDNKEWFKSTFEKSKKEVKKFTRTGKLRIEIASLKKKADDRYTSLGKRTYQLIKDGEIGHKFLDDEYNDILDLEKKISDLENEIEELKKLREDDDYAVENNYIKTDYTVEPNSSGMDDNETKKQKESNE
jgi:hypothetical protein